MGEQEWHHSGVDCCSPFTTCLLSWCCPCIIYGRVHHRLRKSQSLDGYSCCNGSCTAHAALTFCGVGWILQLMQRGELRHRYQLEGNGCTDCLCAFCCNPCDLTQQDKEAKFRGAPGGGDHSKEVVAEQPAATGGMTYQAPQQQPQLQPQYGEPQQQFGYQPYAQQSQPQLMHSPYQQSPHQ
ncbi:PLAC8 family-domain-containing protein [Lineolata rhizophorae]|uniref:PLAC8 family-domain-containing protein n=1 Tax=Lineolata rhizophorae TaxID=578093 RepID=A0A6A6NVW7_9PEZI|nr:PLAC8 family-domain-containing protein [Lineolata rhizophorae]